MIGDLLQTKLYLPIHRFPFLVPRPRLVEKLNAGLDSRLTLVSAPAGFGKTTLIAEWIRSQQAANDTGEDENTNPKSQIRNPQSYAWLSLDEADNDPVLFWSYILAALARAGVSTGQQLLSSLHAASSASSSPPLKALRAGVITRLLNGLAENDGRVILVLDDYHVIDEGAIHEQVGFLLDSLPPQMHLILLTRADPPLSLPRRRARREMAEIRQADLRFERQEAERLLNEMLALDLNADDVAILQQRTEGWAAGLQMAALALGQRDTDWRNRPDRRAFLDSFAGSHHYIMAYLVDEVLKQESPEVQQFLEQTAVLRRLSGPLCAAVTGNAESGLLLQELYGRNLFLIPLDDAHYWFRTHHLFADLLLTRLEQNRGTAEIETLHRRAAEWFEANDFLEEAIYHALRCGDMVWAAGLVEKHARPVMGQGRLNTLLRWIDALPPDVLVQYPRLRIDQAWSLFLSGNAMQMKEILLATRRALQVNPELAPDDAIYGELATMLANCAVLSARSMEEDVERVMAEVEEALAYLPADDADLQSVVFRARALNAAGAAHGLAGDTEHLVTASQEVHRLALLAGNLFLAAHALSMIGEARFHQGRLRDAMAAYRQIVELGDSHSSPPFAGMGYAGQAAVQLERYELAQAAKNLERGLVLSGQGGIGYKNLDAYCTLARLRATERDAEGAVEALVQAKVFAPLSLQKLHLAAYAVRIWLVLGDVAMARYWFSGPLPQRVPVVVGEILQATEARIALAEGNWAEVLARHDTVVTSAGKPSASRLARVVEMTLFKALALEALGEREKALDSLEKAVTLAAPEGAMLTFLEFGPETFRPGLAVLLRALKDQGRGPQPYTDRLLRFFPAPKSSGTAISQLGLVEPLSARELEVLHLIAAGKSNKEIAQALTVTLNTVKKHSSHIYGKLGVNGRTQAVARARELGLI